MSSPFVLIDTADIEWQDNYPFSRKFNDIYFSLEDGIAESTHIYIHGNQLIERFTHWERSHFCLGEVGFGSGLNFLITAKYWLKYAPPQAELFYYACELHPFNLQDLCRVTKNWLELKTFSQELLDNYPILTPGFHYLKLFRGRIHLILMLGDAKDSLGQLLVAKEKNLEITYNPTQINAWYLDGFAPSKNESAWSLELLKNVALLSAPKASIASFSAAGKLRRTLQEFGFEVEKIAGFGTKKEMLRGSFVATSVFERTRRTPWQCLTRLTYLEKKAIIIGAGLSGCFIAHALAQRGWQVTIIDKNEQPAGGASGNQAAILYPKLSAFRSPLTQFMLDAFLYAYQFYSRYITNGMGELNGIMQMAANQHEEQALYTMRDWLEHYPELGEFVSEAGICEKTGLVLSKNGLYIPQSGWIDCVSLCEKLISHPNVQFIQKHIENFHFQDQSWNVGEHKAQVLILANGQQAHSFNESSWLPLKYIKGQMTWINQTHTSQNLKIPICGDGHILPAHQGRHAIGATYHLFQNDCVISANDNQENLKRLQRLIPNNNWQTEIVDAWCGVRCAVADYLPVVGPLPELKSFVQRFSALKDDAKKWIAQPGIYIPGLYICTAFGSRGLTSIPICAEWLASSINNEPSILSQDMVRSLSPARLLIRHITHAKHKLLINK